MCVHVCVYVKHGGEKRVYACACLEVAPGARSA